MSYIDIFFIFLVCIAIIRGAIRGFFKEVASLIAITFAIIGCVFLGKQVGEMLNNALNIDSNTTIVVAYIFVFIIIALIVKLLASALTKLAEAVYLGFINRLLGVVVSVAKISIILSVILCFITFINKDNRLISKETIEDSQTFVPIHNIIPTIAPSLGINKL